MTLDRLAPLAGYRVMITRPAEQCGPLVERVEALGGQSVVLPLIQVAEVDADALIRAVGVLHTYTGVLFTSANAVRALAHICSHQSVTLPPDLVTYAVGPSTERTAQEFGFVARRPPGVKTARQLVDALLAVFGPTRRERLLVPHGTRADVSVYTDLVNAGHDVVTVPAYDIRDAVVDVTAWAEAVTGTVQTVVLLFSPSAVSSMVSQVGAARGNPRPLYAAVGPTTAAACERLGVPVDTVAEQPSDAGILEAVRRMIQSKPETEEA